MDSNNNPVAEATFDNEKILSLTFGPTDLQDDLTFIEDDINRFSQQSKDLTDEATVKSLIANGIEKVEDAADRVTTMVYAIDRILKTDGILHASPHHMIWQLATTFGCLVPRSLTLVQNY